ncbi:MAG: ABC transporter permease subunit [Lachnospiraceae bacterium]|nr:ABC transporter permease subunit [Lachnospiraceae bacterium]
MKMVKENRDMFRERNRSWLLAATVVVGLYIASSVITEFDGIAGITAIPKVIIWIAENLVPDAKAMTRLPKILKQLWETTMLSISVTMAAAVCAFFFALLGANITRVNGIVKRIVRTIAAFFRNVPDVVWAILLMFSFGQNILTGFFALFFTTFGLLTRAFIETIDEVSASCVEALTATGASYMQIIFQGVVPSAVSGLMTWILYMIETNIRSSTLIGMLTATGIGYAFDLYYKRLEYPTASLVVLTIVVLVIAIELLSNKIRKVIL